MVLPPFTVQYMMLSESCEKGSRSQALGKF